MFLLLLPDPKYSNEGVQVGLPPSHDPKFLCHILTFLSPSSVKGSSGFLFALLNSVTVSFSFYAAFASSFEAPSEFHVALQGSSEGSIIPRATLKGSFVGSSSSSFALWGLFHEFQHTQHCSPGFLCDLWTSLQNSAVSSSVLSTTLKSSSAGYPYLHVGLLAPHHL
ncbi:hypothetical protein ATANTOWER_022844 [Ataeniobius toweri]|uniref:Uncharacterized protein n=1 Tax=Ataeniobius toweri TaxID=208326 RepID=A0ABU7AHX3_9TELE|nr:hypothetical protein [Ataeniobius toweri]